MVRRIGTLQRKTFRYVVYTCAAVIIGCGLLLSGLLSSLATRLVPAQPLPAGHMSPAPA